MTDLPLVVLDASAALALVLADEEGNDVHALLQHIIGENGQILVPALFWYELGNVLLSARRADLVDEQAARTAMSLLGRLPIVTDDDAGDAVSARIMTLAEACDLTYYDAAYLELAQRLQCRLMTFDRHLLALRSRYPFIA